MSNMFAIFSVIFQFGLKCEQSNVMLNNEANLNFFMNPQLMQTIFQHNFCYGFDVDKLTVD